MPSLRCLVSALTQAGGGDLLLRFASSVQSCCGEGGALQADVAVCGEHSPCPGHTGFAPLRGVCAFPSTLLRLPAALYGAGPALSAVPVFRSSTKARIRLRLSFVSSPASAARAARGLGTLSPGAVRFPARRAAKATGGLGTLSPDEARVFPPWPQRRPPVGSPEVFGYKPRPVCSVGGGGFSGAEFAPCPSPCLLPPVGMGRLFSGVSQSLCFANRRQCVPAGQFFSRSPTVLKNLPSPALRAFWPVHTLRNAAGSSPFRPLLLVGGCGRLGRINSLP